MARGMFDGPPRRRVQWFLNPGGEIGGEETSRTYVLIYAFGVLVGSAIRLAMAVIPSTALDRLRSRLLP